MRSVSAFMLALADLHALRNPSFRFAVGWSTSDCTWACSARNRTEPPMTFSVNSYHPVLFADSIAPALGFLRLFILVLNLFRSSASIPNAAVIRRFVPKMSVLLCTDCCEDVHVLG